ncbi:MAG: hypothetical protein ABW184_17230 [Sphingobium sp.]
MTQIIGFLALCAAVSAVGAWLLRDWKRGWSRRGVALVAALPVPVVYALLCLFIYVRAAMAPPAACGAGMCEMAMAFAIVGLCWAAVGYGVGLGAAALVVRKVRMP